MQVGVWQASILGTNFHCFSNDTRLYVLLRHSTNSLLAFLKV